MKWHTGYMREKIRLYAIRALKCTSSGTLM